MVLLLDRKRTKISRTQRYGDEQVSLVVNVMKEM